MKSESDYLQKAAWPDGSSRFRQGLKATSMFGAGVIAGVLGFFLTSNLIAQEKPSVELDYGPPITDGVPSGPPEGEWDLAWPVMESQPITNKRKATKSKPQRRVRVPRICTKCNGVGLLACNHCNGAGTISAQFGNIVACWQCGGSGQTRCRICHGRGTR